MSASRAGDEEEIRELREKLVSLTTQLDESNRALERTTNELRSGASYLMMMSIVLLSTL